MGADIERRILVPVPITVPPKLPDNRRYVLPETADFMVQLDQDFHQATGKYLIVDSAIRPATVQKRLRRCNRNAAPATGERASSHERGTTFDLAKKTFDGRNYTRMTKAEYRWLLWRLFYYRETDRILVIEERPCLHVFVGGNDERTNQRPQQELPKYRGESLDGDVGLDTDWLGSPQLWTVQPCEPIAGTLQDHSCRDSY